MNPEMLLNLCSFSYLNLPECFQRRIGRGERVPIREVASQLKRMEDLGALSCGAYLDQAGEVLERVAGYALHILAYENDNLDTGFVGYAFQARDGEVVLAMRGSERAGKCVPSNVDWRDNFCAPLTGSVQYPPAVRFADRFREGPLLLTGHSKGGNVALWGQSQAQNPMARAAVFNAQGFAKREISPERRARMKRGAVNYVVEGDWIGALLYHPELRVYIKQVPGTDPHSPAAYRFNGEGWPVRGRRPLLSRGVEAVSRLIVCLNDEGGLLSRALNFVTTTLLRCPSPSD